VDPDGGLKLTSKVGRVAMGFVAANDRAPGNLDDRNDPAFGAKAHTVIARAVYDLYPQSSLGTIITNREFMDSHSRLFDLDGDLQLTPTLVYRFRAIHTFHQESGQSEQRGNHYTSRLVRSGRHVNLDLFYYHISPDLDTDVGFVRRTTFARGQRPSATDSGHRARG